MATYQVVAEAAHVKNAQGLKLIYKGAFVPDDCDPDRLKHLVDTGMVKEVGSADDTALAPNAAIVPEENATTGGQRLGPDGSVKPRVDGGDGSGDKADPKVQARRDAAKAKLPADGSKPDGRSGDQVFVEYLVGKGYDRAELEKADRVTLTRMVDEHK